MKKSAIPKKAMAMKYDVNEPSKNMKATKGSDFNPKKACDRKTTHKKVNKTDY